MRYWNKMSVEEMYALWNCYLMTDWNVDDPLGFKNYKMKIPVRLTPTEIHKLVEDLFDRLIEKEGLQKNEGDLSVSYD